MSDHPCVSRRLRKEKGTFVIIGFVKWKGMELSSCENHQTKSRRMLEKNPRSSKPIYDIATISVDLCMSAMTSRICLMIRLKMEVSSWEY